MIMKQEKIKKLDKLRRNIIISEIILMIVFMIPIFIGGYIQCKRSDWETDRNFYGKNINITDIKNENKLRQYAAFIEMTKNFIFVNHIYAIYLKIDPQVIEKGGEI